MSDRKSLVEEVTLADESVTKVVKVAFLLVEVGADVVQVAETSILIYSHHHHHVYIVYWYTKHPGPTVYSHHHD